MRTLIAQVSTNRSVRDAIKLFIYQLVKYRSDGCRVRRLDTLVFTGGIGEHQPMIRERVAGALGYLRPFEVHVIPTDENLMIARHVLSVLNA